MKQGIIRQLAHRAMRACIKGRLNRQLYGKRIYSQVTRPQEKNRSDLQQADDHVDETADTGYMKRRLMQLAEESTPIKDDPLSGQAVRMPFVAREEDPRTSAVMTEQEIRDIQERLASRTYKADHVQALAVSTLPRAASKHTRDIAYSRPWTGTESTQDAVLRMLVDVNKPLRVPGGGPRRPPISGSNGNVIPMPTMAKSLPASVRIAEAREKTLEYSLARNVEKTSKSSAAPPERDPEFSKIYGERFKSPRAMPGTLHGLRALADERIEEARARGQFNNIKRGGKLDMDARATSPFLDTTEFFLNRIIQRQDITPPWIDKQTTVRMDLRRFRADLREGWKRHAMRFIASEGGPIDEQMARANRYAAAELLYAKRTGILDRKKDDERLHEENVNELREFAVDSEREMPRADDGLPVDETHSRLSKVEWENLEQSYHELSIKTLNDSIRSYNLMAPAPARRAYLSLARERAICYADAAPLLADALWNRDRLARSGRTTFDLGPRKPGSVVNTVFGDSMVVMEKRDGEYGLKEMFKDMFRRRR
ncbi:uncharacterized protein V1516DRAFT_100104 [Lipomyces oligophaga]|uniref:uncharacterized protein n=1 Tax=Lipomyces oligophaga TaxID=45792 RepID=UPI0034CE7F93